MFITKLGAGRKRQEEKLAPVFLPFTAEPTLMILLYSSFMGFFFFFNLFSFFPRLSVYFLCTQMSFFHLNCWLSGLKGEPPSSPFLSLFTDSAGSFCAWCCPGSDDDLELGFNFETSCSLVNQIGTSGALWPVNTHLNSSVIKIGCWIS